MSPKPIIAIGVRIAFYLGAAFLVTEAWRHAGELGSGNLFRPAISDLTSTQQSALNAYLTVTHLITTLTTGLLAGMGYILTNGVKINRSWATGWIAVGSALCAAFSLFCGYMSYQVLIGMLADQFFDLSQTSVKVYSTAQFFSFLLAVVAFGDFAIHTFFTGDRNEPKPHPSGH
jgi:hypothetical protein